MTDVLGLFLVVFGLVIAVANGRPASRVGPASAQGCQCTAPGDEVCRSARAALACSAGLNRRSLPSTLCPEGAMLTNGATEARKLRSRLSHPIIDADGHCARVRAAPATKCSGASSRTRRREALREPSSPADPRHSLEPSLAERRRRRVGPGRRCRRGGGRRATNVLDRATAHPPAAAVRAPGRPRHRLHDRLPVGWRSGTIACSDDELRRAICRAVQPCSRPIVRAVLDRSHRPGGDHPDVHAGGGASPSSSTRRRSSATGS